MAAGGVPPMIDLTARLVGSWLEARDETTDGLMVFRSSPHVFPRSRGAWGLVFHAGGRLEEIRTGRNDRASVAEARWVLLSESAVMVTFPASARRPYLLHIVSCKADRLVVRRIAVEPQP